LATPKSDTAANALVYKQEKKKEKREWATAHSRKNNPPIRLAQLAEPLDRNM
jgi:hypothetical protein